MPELKLPELGEGVEAVEVSAVLVAVGDVVRREQPVIEVETEKASLEVPSDDEGRIVELLVKVGDRVRVGQTILRLDVGTRVEPAQAAAAPQPASEGAPATPTLAVPAAITEVLEFPAVATVGARLALAPPVPAAPSVRALARQLGIDVAQVTGSARGGRVSREDVKAYAKTLIESGSRGVPAVAAAELPDFSTWGQVEREPMSVVRRATARAMSVAWSQVPTVTQFDRADVTQLEALRRGFNVRPEAAKAKLTLTAIVVKLVASALKQCPKFNASIDPARESVIYKKYVHVGVAVDTERGLLVPVVRDADKKALPQINAELADLAARARSKKVMPDELRGATFTVSNLGGLGTTYFSPIVNWPEVAILGVGRAEPHVQAVEGKFESRLFLPLSLSYDHRLIDGADAARFLRRVAESLEQPLLLLLDE